MTQTTARLKEDENGREYYEYSIISKLNDKNEVEHSYTGYVNGNANVENPIMEPFGEEYKHLTPYYKRKYFPASILKKTQEEHERLLKSIIKIKTIETKITSYIK